VTEMQATSDTNGTFRRAKGLPSNREAWHERLKLSRTSIVVACFAGAASRAFAGEAPLACCGEDSFTIAHLAV
jgi:hypothetical protein